MNRERSYIITQKSSDQKDPYQFRYKTVDLQSTPNKADHSTTATAAMVGIGSVFGLSTPEDLPYTYPASDHDTQPANALVEENLSANPLDSYSNNESQFKNSDELSSDEDYSQAPYCDSQDYDTLMAYQNYLETNPIPIAQADPGLDPHQATVQKGREQQRLATEHWNQFCSTRQSSPTITQQSTGVNESEQSAPIPSQDIQTAPSIEEKREKFRQNLRDLKGQLRQDAEEFGYMLLGASASLLGLVGFLEARKRRSGNAPSRVPRNPNINYSRSRLSREEEKELEIQSRAKELLKQYQKNSRAGNLASLSELIHPDELDRLQEEEPEVAAKLGMLWEERDPRRSNPMYSLGNGIWMNENKHLWAASYWLEDGDERFREPHELYEESKRLQEAAEEARKNGKRSEAEKIEAQARQIRGKAHIENAKNYSGLHHNFKKKK